MFKFFPPPPPPPPPPTEAEREALLKQGLSALEERLAKHERTVKAMQLEWDEWYDKFRLLFARLTKRVTEAQKAEEATQEPLGRTNGRPRMVGDLPEHPEPPGPRRNY